MILKVKLVNKTKSLIKIPQIQVRNPQIVLINPSPAAHHPQNHWIETLEDGRSALLNWSAYHSLELNLGESIIVSVDENHVFARFKKLTWVVDNEGNSKIDFVALSSEEFEKINPLKGKFPCVFFRNLGGLGGKSVGITDPTLNFMDSRIEIPAGLLVERHVSIFSPFSTFSTVSFRDGFKCGEEKRPLKEIKKLFKMRDVENLKLVQAGYQAVLPDDGYEFKLEVGTKK